MAGEWSLLNVFSLTTAALLWVAVLFLAFLLLGMLRALGVLTWRLEQLEATTPRRVGRDGLAPGKKAPDFTLTSDGGHEVSLHDFAGRKVLLVFVQPQCGPCHAIVPQFNRLASRGALQILAIINGPPECARKWVADTGTRFPVLSQHAHSISKRYEVFATPFVFVIDGDGVIRSKGLVTSKHHLGYVLSSQDDKAKSGHVESERNDRREGEISGLGISEREMSHV